MLNPKFAVFNRVAATLQRPTFRLAIDAVVGTVLITLGLRLAID